MRKAAFVLGYAGGILALICALMMIYTVPQNLAGTVIEDIGNDLEQENIIAFGEMMQAADQEWPDTSREGLTEFADEVADSSQLIRDSGVFEETALFVYRAGLNAFVSGIIVLVSIVLAFVAFFGSLMSRKRQTAGGVMMMVSALLLLIAAFYTQTVMPTVLASLALIVAGILCFVPEPVKRANDVRDDKYRPYSQANAASGPRAKRDGMTDAYPPRPRTDWDDFPDTPPVPEKKQKERIQRDKFDE